MAHERRPPSSALRYEYARPKGSYALYNILSGARYEDLQAAEAARTEVSMVEGGTPSVLQRRGLSRACLGVGQRFFVGSLGTGALHEGVEPVSDEPCSGAGAVRVVVAQEPCA